MPNAEWPLNREQGWQASRLEGYSIAECGLRNAEWANGSTFKVQRARFKVPFNSGFRIADCGARADFPHAKAPRAQRRTEFKRLVVAIFAILARDRTLFSRKDACYLANSERQLS